VIFGESRPEPADLIVAFEGMDGRARAAYALADENFAAALVISPATDRKLGIYDRRFNPQREFDRIIEEKARTTFENAFYTVRIIEAHQFDTVILVTSWNHMPRSYLLLKTLLLGTDTKIRPYSVATGTLSRNNWYRYAVGWKLLYNEMLESWGSFVEYMHFKISGELFHSQQAKTGLISRLKNELLFNVKIKELTLDPMDPS
jgi:hypothetical protein